MLGDWTHTDSNADKWLRGFFCLIVDIWNVTWSVLDYSVATPEGNMDFVSIASRPGRMSVGSLEASFVWQM